MDEFLDIYELPKLNQENFETLKNLIKGYKIEAVIKILSAKKLQGLDGFSVALYHLWVGHHSNSPKTP